MQRPTLLYPIDTPGIFFYPERMRFLLSDIHIAKGQTIAIGSRVYTIVQCERIEFRFFITNGKLEVHRNILTYSTPKAVRAFLLELGYADVRSFLGVAFNVDEAVDRVLRSTFYLAHFSPSRILPSI